MIKIYLSDEEIKNYIQSIDATRFLRLQNYYESSSDILERTFNDTTKPNNKIVHNFAKYIVDIIQGYFLGKGITYTSENKDLLEAVKEIFANNTEDVHTAELAKQIAIKGRCYELVYIDELGEIGFGKVNAENVCPIYDKTIKMRLIGAIRSWKEKDTEYIEIYDSETLTKVTKKGSTITREQPINHNFSQLSIIEYKNNAEGTSDFEPVLTLIDSYDKSRSNTQNDFDYFTDAYLVLSGADISLEADSDEIKTMKQNRLIVLPENSTANFLIKNINDVATENNNDRLRRDIHKFSFTPDLTDNMYSGSISGIALQFQLFGLEQITANKEQRMRLGLYKRLELIVKYINLIYGTNYDYKEIDITFTRNIPINKLEQMETAVKALTVMSKKTVLKMYTDVLDVEQELENIEEEQGLNMDMGMGTEEITKDEKDIEEEKENDL